MTAPSRVKNLDTSQQARDRITHGTSGDGGTGPSRSRAASRSAALPYGKLPLARPAHGPPVQGADGDGSPLKKMFGMLQDRIQSVMKTLFPFKLFSDATEQIGGEPAESPVQRADADEDKTAADARKVAYGELAALFSSRELAPTLSTEDLTKVVALVNSTSPARLIPPSALHAHRALDLQTTSFGMKSKRAFMTTPLPRRLHSGAAGERARGTVQRIAPPSTQLKFRTRPFAPILDEVVAADQADEEREIELELCKSPYASPKAPAAAEPAEPLVEEAPAAVPVRMVPSKNRFSGVFYLDPDEEEEELLRQEREALAQEERIKTLVVRREQRERKVAVRQTEAAQAPAADRPADAPAKAVQRAEPAKPIFDFGSSTAPAGVASVAAAPVVRAPPTLELPSATTKLAMLSEQQEMADGPLARKPKRMQTESVPFTFGAAPPSTAPEAGSVAEPVPAASSAEAPKPAAFSFGAPPSETVPKPVFTFGTQTPASVDAKPAAAPAMPQFTFSFGAGAEKPAAPPVDAPQAAAPQEAAPQTAFTFGAATPVEPAKPVFTFGAPEGPSAYAKPAPFTFGQPEAKPFVFGAAPTQPTAQAAAQTTTQATAQTAAQPAFTFGAPQAEQPKPPVFTFGTQGTGQPEAKLPFAFGAQPEPPKPAFTFGAAPTASAPFTFGGTPVSHTATATEDSMMDDDSGHGPGMAQPTPTPSAVPAFTFGGASAATSAPPAFAFGQPPAHQPQQPFGFAPSPAPSSSAPPQFTFGAAATQPAAPPSPFTFGAPPAPFTFGQPAAAAPFTFGQQPAAASNTMDTGLGQVAALPAIGGFNVGSVPQHRKPTQPAGRARRR